MDIKYIGHSCFRIKGKQAVIITDPFDVKKVGLSYPNTPADIVTVSHEHEDHNNLERITGDPIVLRGPGEYEIREVRIYGYPTFHDESKGAERGKNTIYLLIIDEIRILHAGDLGHPLSDELLDDIGDVDILIIPTGGHFTLDAKKAVSLVKKIEPHIVIPMHYKQAGLSSAFDELQEVDMFAKELDKPVTPIDKLIITCDKLPQDLELVVLNI